MRNIAQTYKALLKQHGPQGWWPLLELGDPTYKRGDKSYGGYHPGDYSYPKTDSQRFEICVGAIFTQNTSWNNVVKALLNLKKSNALSADGVKRLSMGKLRELIKPAGYYNQKAKKLKLFVAFYLKLAGRTPTREELLSVWGIGKETADSILLYAYMVPIFVVDAYTRRLFGYDKKEDYDKIRLDFEDALPKDYQIYQEYHALIVEQIKKR